MVYRQLNSYLKQLCESFPAVGIIGPRQCGKTTLVREQLFAEGENLLHLDLEDPRDRALLTDPIDYLERKGNQTIVIDEVQLMPELFSVLRPLIDANRRPGRFILLGSASPQIIRGASESLAGRIAYAELTPFTLIELHGPGDQADLVNLWINGGYPLSYLAPSIMASLSWRTQYLESYITRELPQLGAVGDTATLRRLVSMMAGQQGELVNKSSLARALGSSESTVRSYLSLLEQSFLIRALKPYSINVKKRLVKAPKVYIRDSGLLHALLRIQDESQLRDSISAGGSWEGFIIEQLLAVVSHTCEAYFYRTHTGAEVDLVLIGRRGRMACIEIKLSSTPKPAKGFYTALTDLGPEKTLVVASVKDSYRLAPNVEAVSLTTAMSELKGW